MPRRKRIWMPDHFYHIVCRGNRRDPLFISTDDFQAFFHILHQLHEEIPFELASYCLMTNHFHLQMRSSDVSISKVMSLINKRYANYYNTKYCLSGHVFEKRFYDSLIVDLVGMLKVSRYIHLNPVEAKIVKHPEDYPWSSYIFYYDQKRVRPEYLNMGHVLELYEGSEEEKNRQYCENIWEDDRRLIEK
ncbi:transposase [Siminovitchia sediminis]|uniref:Transposase n=1 Tax=Siminovitchia sediminis TaxID=1274353 RepID=A0ABW4KJ18_9BACI